MKQFFLPTPDPLTGQYSDADIQAFLPFIRHIAHRFYLPSQSPLQVEDLVQEGCLGLLHAFGLLNPADATGPGTPLYLAFWVRHYIRQAIRAYGYPVRLPQHQPASDQDPLSEPQAYLPHALSLDHVIGSDEDLSGDSQPMTMGDTLRDDRPLPDQLLITGQDNAHLRTLIHSLPPRLQQIICWTYGIDAPVLTSAQIANQLGLNDWHVRKLRERALRHLRKRC